MTNTKQRKPTKEEMDYARRTIHFSDNDYFRFVLASDDQESQTILKTISSCMIKRKVVNHSPLVEVGASRNHMIPFKKFDI